jgi:lipopolysaccharide export LptBFGC system permease protein LptF
MKLLTAHRILIGAAILFFVFYSLWEFSGARGTGGGPWGTARAVIALLAAGAFGAYFLSLMKRGAGG